MSESRKIGDYFAVRWVGRGRDVECEVSPSFPTIEECRKWLGRSRRYVIKRKVAEPGGGSDGFEYVERTGV